MYLLYDFKDLFFKSVICLVGKETVKYVVF